MNRHWSKEELQQMKQMDIRDAERDTLADISGIETDMEKSVSARAADYAQKAGNPYLVKVGDYVVKTGYSDCSETFNDRMKQYIRKIAEIKD